MAWRVELTAAAAKHLAKLDRQAQQRVAAKIRALADDPTPAGVKRLQGGGREYRVRVGDYRIIYTLDGGRLVVLVVKIGHRRDVYGA